MRIVGQMAGCFAKQKERLDRSCSGVCDFLLF